MFSCEIDHYIFRKITIPTYDTQNPLTTAVTRIQLDTDLPEVEHAHVRADKKAMNLILLGLSIDIYSTVESCPSAYAMWKAIERHMQATKVGQQEKENQDEANDIRAELKRRKHDPLALVSNTCFAYSMTRYNNQPLVPPASKNTGYANAGCVLPTPMYSSSTYVAPSSTYNTSVYALHAPNYTSSSYATHAPTYATTVYATPTRVTHQLTMHHY
ncbi:hypothetical protein Tco_0024673 [Tanacetum coccineum]